MQDFAQWSHSGRFFDGIIESRERPGGAAVHPNVLARIVDRAIAIQAGNQATVFSIQAVGEPERQDVIKELAMIAVVKGLQRGQHGFSFCRTYRAFGTCRRGRSPCHLKPLLWAFGRRRWSTEPQASTARRRGIPHGRRRAVPVSRTWLRSFHTCIQKWA